MDLLREHFGESKTSPSEERFNCPFCGETDHKMYVNTKNLRWICFKCDKRGNIISIIREYFSMSFPDAIELLQTYGYNTSPILAYMEELKSSEGYDELTEEEIFRIMFLKSMEEPEEAISIVDATYTTPPLPTGLHRLQDYFDNPMSFPFLNYLNGRNVTLEQIVLHDIGFILNGETTGSSGKLLPLQQHIFFPTRDIVTNDIVYWNTRNINQYGLKSINAPSGEGEYGKNNTVFNLNNAQHTDKLVIAEGVFDALAIGDSGIATFGKFITDDQLDLIVKGHRTRPDNKIYIFLDPDEVETMVKLAKRLKSKNVTEVYYINNPGEKDPADLGHENCQTLISKAIKANEQGEMQLMLGINLSS